jgi:integrase/recombinase XerD
MHGIAALQQFIAKPLCLTTLADLQAWDGTLAHLAPATRHHRLAAAKSLFAFAVATGAIDKDPGASLRAPRAQSMAPERILTEIEVARMIGAETDARARGALRLLYFTGMRNAELCDLRWRHLTPARKGGGAEARVTGKGNKTRVVMIPRDLWRELLELAPGAKPDAPVIPGRNGEPINERALHRLVRHAAARIGTAASPHWLRHAHASHALDHGAPVQVVQKTLGHASLATTSLYVHMRPGDSSSAYIGAR